MLHNKTLKLVIVKIQGRPPTVAAVVREGRDSAVVKLSLGHHKFSPRSRRVTIDQVLREAMARERELGFVPPTMGDAT